jgi:hypothetical protein
MCEGEEELGSGGRRDVYYADGREAAGSPDLSRNMKTR